MACFHPIEGFPRPGGGITWSPPQGYTDLPKMKVPCGQCIGCRLDRGRQWTARLMHEASLHKHKCFITLTYDKDHLPPDGSLRHSDFQAFIRKFRDHLRAQGSPKQISYFMCGEYGETLGRPHYHAILFGHDFGELVYRRSHSDWTDARKVSSREKGCYSSEELARFWIHGGNTVGAVSVKSAGYVARYCLKKVTGVRADEHYKRVNPDTGEIYWLVPEYAHMSTRPAIGKVWFSRFGSDVTGYDSVFVDGQRLKSPRYYDKLRKRVNTLELAKAKRKRRFEAIAKSRDATPERLAVREEVATARSKLFNKRSLENGR